MQLHVESILWCKPSLDIALRCARADVVLRRRPQGTSLRSAFTWQWDQNREIFPSMYRWAMRVICRVYWMSHNIICWTPSLWARLHQRPSWLTEYRLARTTNSGSAAKWSTWWSVPAPPPTPEPSAGSLRIDGPHSQMHEKTHGLGGK